MRTLERFCEAMNAAAIALVRAADRMTCGFQDPSTLEVCGLPGVRLRLRDDLGRLVIAVRCHRHSDWVQAPAPETPPS